MTELRKAAEMALEACEHLHRTGDTQVFDLCYADKVIPALRQALAQPRKETFTLDRGCWERGCVAYDERDGDAVNISAERVDETAKGEHEPVGYVTDSGMSAVFIRGINLDDDTPLYTAPPKREWVGLTEDEVAQAMYRADAIITGPMQFKFSKEIEAKLKEKNT